MCVVGLSEHSIQVDRLPDEGILDFKAKVFKILNDPNRVMILEILRQGERCQCEITPLLDQSQPTVSRHLKLLDDAGLIKSRRDGNKTLYCVVNERIFNVLDAIDQELIQTLSDELKSRLLTI